MKQSAFCLAVILSGFVLTYLLSNWIDASSTLAAAGIILVSFLFTRFFKVAGRHNVSKMGTAWLTQELRQMIWRMLLTLVLAALAFRLAYPHWGVAFWLSMAAYYQIGLLLHLRVIRQPNR